MCGLAGYLTPLEPKPENLLIQMGDAIRHRGPDASAIWFDINDGIGFCHRRLSIIDLSDAGAQPMHSHSGRYVMVFNGEIYNFHELRSELDKKNTSIPWRGHSDTEVILAGFEAWGIEKTLKQIDGMFAIAVWDKKNKELFLARDRMGEKPIYYGWQGDSFIFASELKALHYHPAFKKEICLEALGAFFKYNYIPVDTSIYKGIKKLKQGTFCKVSLIKKTVEHTVYWELKEATHCRPSENGNLEHNINALENLLKRVIRNQMIADVPLGAFLSGGVDSSTIVALMQIESRNPVKTFCIGFNEKNFDEAEYAKKVAWHLGTDHTELYVSSQTAQNVIPSLSEIYDEPFADSSQIPTFLISQMARKHVKVSLSGDGGDELFGGYEKYIKVNKALKRLSAVPTGLRHALSNVLLSQPINKLDIFYDTISNIVPKRYEVTNFGDKVHKFASLLNVNAKSRLHDGFTSHWKIDEIFNSPIDTSPLNLDFPSELSFTEKMMCIDIKNYLPDDILVKVDRAAMANSLETRIPFLDHKLVEFAFNLPIDLKIRNGQGKWLLRELLYRYVPKKLIERPRMGFSIPLDSWLRRPLKEWATDLLSPTNLDKHGFLNKELILKRLNEHVSGKKNWQNQLWNVLMFQSWYDKFH
jgi:asparagine synthase (glutamine-hydrolysing)